MVIRIGGLREGDREFDSAVGGTRAGDAAGGRSLEPGRRPGLVGLRDQVGVAEDIWTNRTESRTSPMVSLAADDRLGRRWSLGLEVSSFTVEHTFNVGVHGVFHF